MHPTPPFLNLEFIALTVALTSLFLAGVRLAVKKTGGGKRFFCFTALGVVAWLGLTAGVAFTPFVDNAPAHHARSITIPSNVVLMFLPPYSPERSPAERVRQYMKDHLAGRIFDSLDALSVGIEQVIKSIPQDVIASLTSPDWLMQIVNAQLSI